MSADMPTIGVLALQGDFAEHETALRELGARPRQVRTREDFRGIDGLIIPGGESTTFCRLLEDFSLYEPLNAFVRSGAPVWGTCAGMIVLARTAHGLPFPTLQAIDIEVDRNAYGRQVDSFEADLEVPVLGESSFHAVFIRAPVVRSVGEGVDVLASHAHDDDEPGAPVAVKQGPIMATAFHPELTPDRRFHRYFLDLVRSEGGIVSGK
jgi:5'-phosphate synthase pdxT subunit